MGAVFTRRVVAMKRSRTEVGRWRMLRLAIRKGLVKRQRHALLFIFPDS